MPQPDISRRSFLGGLLVLSAAIAVPAEALTLAPAALIYGDGIHDDTDGLNALFRGEPVHFVNDNATVRSGGGMVYLSGGTYRISDTIRFEQPVEVGRLRLKVKDFDGPLFITPGGSLRAELVDVEYLNRPTYRGMHYASCVTVPVDWHATA